LKNPKKKIRVLIGFGGVEVFQGVFFLGGEAKLMILNLRD
jgi:hypothetical protein